MVEISNAKQRRTLERIFEDKPPKDILWQDVVSLFEHLRYKMYGMGGSLFCFKKSGSLPYHEHRPHPSKHLLPATVRKLRRYLEMMGVTP